MSLNSSFSSRQELPQPIEVYIGDGSVACTANYGGLVCLDGHSMEFTTTSLGQGEKVRQYYQLVPAQEEGCLYTFQVSGHFMIYRTKLFSFLSTGLFIAKILVLHSILFCNLHILSREYSNIFLVKWTSLNIWFLLSDQIFRAD